MTLQKNKPLYARAKRRGDLSGLKLKTIVVGI